MPTLYGLRVTKLEYNNPTENGKVPFSAELNAYTREQFIAAEKSLKKQLESKFGEFYTSHTFKIDSGGDDFVQPVSGEVTVMRHLNIEELSDLLSQ